MRKEYETVMILKVSDNNKKVVKQYHDFIQEKSSKVIKQKTLGIKSLAYIVQGQNEGFYVTFIHNICKEDIPELEMKMRADSKVLKFITIEVDLDNYLLEKDYIPRKKCSAGSVKSEQSSRRRSKKIVDVFDLIYNINEGSDN